MSGKIIGHDENNIWYLLCGYNERGNTSDCYHSIPIHTAWFKFFVLKTESNRFPKLQKTCKTYVTSK